MKFLVEVSDEILPGYEVIDLADAIADAVAAETGAVCVKVKEVGEPMNTEEILFWGNRAHVAHCLQGCKGVKCDCSCHWPSAEEAARELLTAIRSYGIDHWPEIKEAAAKLRAAMEESSKKWPTILPKRFQQQLAEARAHCAHCTCECPECKKA